MKLIFAGDVFITKPEKFSIKKDLQQYISSHDIICCNFEAPIKTDVNPILKRGIALSQSESTPKKLSEYGFNLISLANNHIMDYGRAGLENTLNVFSYLDIPTIGADFSDEKIYAPYILNHDNQKIAILSLCQAEFGVKKMKKGSAGYAWISEPSLKNIIPKIKQNVNVLIILCHAGLEDEIYPLPEWQERYRYFIDLGADYVIGNHPHVIQGYEEYKNKFICYSLGNFIFDSENDDRDEYTRSLLVSIDTDKLDYKIIAAKFINETIEFDDSLQTKNDLEKRSEILLNAEKLNKWADGIAEKLWSEYYRSYYTSLHNIQTVKNTSVLGLFKAIIKKIVKYGNFYDDFDDTMLLHNIQIETHKWIVERYLYNKNIKENNL